MSLFAVTADLNEHANRKRAKSSMRFFKTGVGEYGEGDHFIGLTMPQIRTIAKKFIQLSHQDVKKLLDSPIHEYRMAGLLILTYRFNKSKIDHERQEIYDFYINNLAAVNNWDLVDVTTPHIIGGYMLDNPHERKRLYVWAQSTDIWERRIAMLATFPLLRNGQFDDALSVAEILINDTHDLIHKAVGWMLREIGKIDGSAEEMFLNKHYQTMPRTMLRYAIEKFTPSKRDYYMGR